MSKPTNRRSAAQSRAAPSRHWDAWIALLVALSSLIVFSPALRNEFVGWDDYDLLVNNPYYRGLGWEQLRWMFSTFHQGHYQPLSWITLGLDFLIWGMDPFGYHLTNLFIHAANAVLFYFLALRLLSLVLNSSSPAWRFDLRATAGFSALFFALHPLRVESVVWATERRDVLSGFFFLATILFYLQMAADSNNSSKRRRWLAAALLCYVLSLLSKASGVTIPAVLLLLDVYPLARLGGGAGRWFGPAARRIWREKILFLALAAPAIVIAPLAQSDAGAVASLRAHGIAARLAQSAYGAAFYLWKTILPVDLSPLYEVPRHLSLFAWPVLLSGATIALVSIVAVIVRRRWPAVLASWLYYGLVIAPVLGIVQSGRQLVADRYSYLSCLAWALLAGGALFHWWRRGGDQQRANANLFAYAPTAAATIVVVFALLTVRQVHVWHDTIGLFKHAAAITDKSIFRSATAHHLAARFLADRGEIDEAIEHLKTSLEIEPNDFTIYSDLGVTLVKRGRLDEAIEYFRHALALNPNLSLSHFYLGNALALQGRLGEAAQHFQDALRINPDYPQAYNNLGKIMAAQGQLDNAIEMFRRALQIQPDFAEAHRNLALALDEQGRKDEAKQEFQEAAKIMNLRSQVRER